MRIANITVLAHNVDQAYALVFEYTQACASGVSRLAAVQARVGRWGGG